MRNPIQEYNLARSLPIQALANVLRGVSDMVSLGVAHAALKEKMEAEVAKKGASAMQMAQAPKVVNKDLAMAQGLGASPADVDVPMGGIVGGEGTFGTGAAGGGSVVAFQAGGQPSLQTVLNQLSLQERMDYQRSGRLPERFRQMLAGETPMPQAEPRRPGRATTFTEAAQAQGLGATPLSTDTMSYYPGMGPLIQRQATQAQAQAAALQPSLPVDYSKSDMGLVMGSATDPGVATESLADFEKRMAAKEKPSGGIADLASGKDKEPASTDYAGLMQQSKEAAKEYAVARGDKKNLTDFTQDYVKALKEGGFDFNLVQNQIAEIRKEKEELKGDREEATNLRLLEAGLGILGGESPYAFVNIGKGATPALQGLAKDIKEIKKTRRELDKETMQLQLMQNQMAEGKVKYAQGRLDKQEERLQRLDEKDKEIQFRMFDRMASDSTQRYVANISKSTAAANLQATQLEREQARDDRLIKAAQEQAAKDVRDNPLAANMTPSQKEAEISRLARMYYANMTALRKGEGAAQTSTDPVAAARAEMERRGLR
jgi:hypothetical protein